MHPSIELLSLTLENKLHLKVFSNSEKGNFTMTNMLDNNATIDSTIKSLTKTGTKEWAGLTLLWTALLLKVDQEF